MDRFQVETSQNVDLDYALASLGDRIVAYIIDSLVKFGYIIAIILLAVLISAVVEGGNIFAEDDPPVVFIVLFIILLIPMFFYSLLFEIFNDGQTPGKKAQKIKVVSVDGSPVSIGSYLLRWLFRIIDQQIYGIVAIILIASTDKNQRLGDLLAKTTVIKLDKKVSLKDTIASTYKEDHYQPVFLQAKKLSSTDIETIKKVLNTPEYRGNTEMVSRLANKIRETMGVNSTLSDLRLLNTVIKDYNHYHSL